MWRKSRKLASSEAHAPGTKKECNKLGNQSLGTRYSIEENIGRLWGFRLNDLSSFEKFTTLLYQPTDPASLGVVRALFGRQSFIAFKSRNVLPVEVHENETKYIHRCVTNKIIVYL